VRRQTNCIGVSRYPSPSLPLFPLPSLSRYLSLCLCLFMCLCLCPCLCLSVAILYPVQLSRPTVVIRIQVSICHDSLVCRNDAGRIQSLIQRLSSHTAGARIRFHFQRGYIRLKCRIRLGFVSHSLLFSTTLSQSTTLICRICVFLIHAAI
jgi:hypothetical protein